MKRAVDLIIALPGLLVLAVAAPFVVLMIRLDSPGPAIFTQTRVGRGERRFRCFKFRTMYVGASEVPTHEALERTITRVGRALRASKIDELPQLFNVVRGDMSLVGPRPCLLSQTKLIEERRARAVMDWLPGVTGLAQVRGVDMSDPLRLAEVDAEYVNSQSLLLDLRIICATFLGRKFFQL